MDEEKVKAAVEKYKLDLATVGRVLNDNGGLLLANIEAGLQIREGDNVGEKAG